MDNYFQEIQEEEAVGLYAKYSDVLKAVEDAEKSKATTALKR